jgi:hypothetical protein
MNKEQTKITYCKDCIFALFKDNKQQTCILGNLWKFIDQDKIILMGEGEKEYFAINRLCQHYRDTKWKFSTTSLEKQISQVYDETFITCDIVVYVKEDSSESEIISTCKSLQILENKPSQILLIIDHNKIKPSFYKKYLDRVGVPYRLDFMTNTTKGEYLSILGDKCKGIYFCLVDAGQRLPINLLTKINDIVNHQMRPLLVLHSAYYLVVSKLFFKLIGQSEDHPFLKRLKDFTHPEKSLYIIEE